VVRYLGLDYGEKTIGVSVGCTDSKVATGLTTIRRAEEAALRSSINDIRDIIRQYDITHIVLGHPLNMDGSISMRAEKTLAFRDKLQRNFKSIKFIMWDERLSTRAVTQGFGAIKGSRNKREAYRAHVDEMAAVYILQGFLNKLQEETMENENNLPDEQEMNDIIIVTDDDGSEYQLHVLASREHNENVYLLTAMEGEDDDEEEPAEVMHFKCIMNEESEDDDDLSMETVDITHEDFELVLELFKDDYEELGITLDEGDSLLGF